MVTIFTVFFVYVAESTEPGYEEWMQGIKYLKSNDAEEAMKWFKKSADLGYYPAMGIINLLI